MIYNTYVFNDNETPGGAIDGVNTTFTLANTPVPLASLNLVYNGQPQLQGAGNDYTITGGTITFTTAPASGTWLRAWYRY